MEFTTIGKAKRQTGISYLGGVDISQKIVKSQKVDKVMTYCLYLSPANTSGHNVCPHSTPECRRGCLATSGRAKMEIHGGINRIKNARISKTKLFFEHGEFFMDWLIAEIEKYQRKALREGMGFAIRLNGTSDIDWENVIHKGKNIFQHFPKANFYDYTKQSSKFDKKSKNYHLTLSYTGRNWEDCKAKLNAGYNVAMVFNIPNSGKLPSRFDGYDVIDGDITDFRVKDKKGIIAGLHWKRIADKVANEEVRHGVFAVQVDDSRNEWSI